MASAVASGFSLVAPSGSLHLQKSQNRQVVTAKGVHAAAAVNCFVEKSNLGNRFPKTRIQRITRQSPSRKVEIDHDRIYKLNVAAGAESNANLEGGDSEKESSVKESEMKRRELLWGATGTFSYLSSAGLAQSAPVPPPDLDIHNCSPVKLKSGFQDGCLPDPSGLTPELFKFENLPTRTRKPAHILSQDPVYVSKYNEAYRLMKALPDDPRSFKNQWHIHAAFCVGAYPEPRNSSNSKLPLNYHANWTFLPWHRMYLYFHERILGELIGDPSFALPFWNNQTEGEGGNQMPRMFTDDRGSMNDVLRTAIRNPQHLPAAVGDNMLAYVNLAGQTGGLKEIIQGNLSLVHKAVVSSVSAQSGAYSANQPEATKCPGSCETEGHNIIHRWTGSFGNPEYPDNQDMGVFTYAARDPIFFSHHANVDRLWTVWKTLPVSIPDGRTRWRRESRQSDFLETQFAFYDHKKRLVYVKVKQTLNTTRLRYEYEAMPSDSDWIYFQSRPSGLPKPFQSDIEAFAETSPILAKNESRSFLLKRRDSTDEDTNDHDDEDLTPNDLEETLWIKGVRVPPSTYMAYRVFINRPDAHRNTPLDIFEFAGMITHLPHEKGGGHDHSRGLDFRVSIRTAVKKLALPVGESVSVTFVPVNQREEVLFDGLESEWR